MKAENGAKLCIIFSILGLFGTLATGNPLVVIVPLGVTVILAVMFSPF